MKTNYNNIASKTRQFSMRNLFPKINFKIPIFGVLILIFMSITSEIKATHFEGGTLTWQQAGGNSITFTVNATWRRSFVNFPNKNVGGTNTMGNFNFGDGSPIVNMVATVNAIDILNDKMFMTWTYTKTYSTAGNKNVTAFYSQTSSTVINCCRDSQLLNNNNDKEYRLQSIVNVGSPYNNPPVSSLPSTINLPVNATGATFTIPATDPDGDALTFRLSSTLESGLVTLAPPGFALTQSGIVTLNTTTKTIGQRFALQVMIQDGKTKTPVDFVIEMVGPSAPPIFGATSPAQNQVFNVTPPGVPVSFVIDASDPDNTQTTTLNSISLPLGATMSPTLPITSSINGIVTSTFNWTPSVAQVGSYVLNFVAQDNVGIQSFRSVTINVLCPLSIDNVVISQTSCPNIRDGAISLDVINGTANLQYSWSGPNGFISSNEDISGLAVGTYNLTVTDISTGCFTNTSQEVSSIADIIAPVPDVPNLADITAECSVIVTSIPTATDNCAGIIEGTTADPLEYDAQGSYEIVWIFADGNGNSVSQTQNVVIMDVTPPVIPKLPTVIEECSATVSVPTGSDNCLGTIIATTKDPLEYTTQGVYEIIWTFDDGHGNAPTVIQTVIVKDVTDPVIPKLPTVIEECSATVSAPTGNDNCLGTIIATTKDPLEYTTQGIYEIIWTFDDGHGNAPIAVQTVIVKDNTPPVLPIINDISIDCKFSVTIPTTTDNCAGEIEGTTADPLEYEAQGIYEIEWTFADGNGNSVSKTQKVTIVDGTAPIPNVLNLADITAECSVIVASKPTATDNCAGIIEGTTADPLEYDAQGIYEIEWTFADGNGNSVSQTQKVIIKDVTPPSEPNLIDVVGECSATVTAPTTTDNCAGTLIGTTTDPLTYNTQGIYEINWTFDDGNGNTIIVQQNVIVDDVTDPGTPTLVDVTGECSATAIAPTTTDNCAGTIEGTTNDPLSYSTLGTHVITWTFADGNGNSIDQTQNVVVVDETAPIISVINVPLDPIAFGSSINLSADFSDGCDFDDHTASWNWGDGSSSSGTVSQQANEVTGSHSYSEPGVYIISLTVTDGSSNSGTLVSTTYAVIYDPNGSFITGGGWIMSPLGAYIADETMTGKANFGFVSKYQKGKNIPTGNTTFHLNAAGFKFKSTSYEWLVVAGANGKFKGEGQVNDGGNYGFMLTGIDGAINGDGIDKFRIKIWDKNNSDAVVYDNQLGSDDTGYDAQEISGGSITIHQAAKDRESESLIIDAKSSLEIIVYPNPAKDYINIIMTGATTNQDVFIFNQVGKLIWKGQLEHQNGASETNVNTGQYDSGIYFIRAEADKEVIVKRFMILN